MGRLGWRGLALGAAASLVASGCELTPVAVVRPDDVIVVEAWAIRSLQFEGSLDAMAYLHRTHGADELGGVPGASVRLVGEGGGEVHLVQQDTLVCRRVVGVVWPRDVGSCYRASPTYSPFAPGEQVELEVIARDGRRLASTSRLPGAFAFTGLEHDQVRCSVEPGTHTRFEWTQADHAWGYFADARVEGLPEALGEQEFEVPDSLYISGWSTGSEDTDIVFPQQFGLIEFVTDANREVVRRLHEGIPGNVRTDIDFLAIDRNWMNWARRETTDPNWAARIPSVYGDGSGWFGTATHRRVHVVSATGEDAPPRCSG